MMKSKDGKTSQPRVRNVGDTRSRILIVLGYLVATIVFTFPMCFRMGDFIKDVPTVDYGVNLWNLSWCYRWLTVPGAELLHTDYILYPEGVSLASHTLSVLNGVLSFPLQAVFGVVVSYNVLVLASFFLTAVATYLMARQWGASRLGAFLVGLWFAFSTYRFRHWNHINLLSTHWLVLFLWALSRFLLGSQTPTKSGFFLRQAHSRTGIVPIPAGANLRYRDAFWTGLLASATALCSWYYIVFATLCGLVLSIAVGLRRRRELDARRCFVGALIAIVSFSAIMSPYLYCIFTTAQDAPAKGLDLALSAYFSADLLSHCAPHSFIRKLFTPADKFAFTGETPGAIFPGLLLVFFPVAVLVLRKRYALSLDWEWTFVAGFFAVLSLGPYLKVNGLVKIGEYFLLPMPGIVLRQLPMMRYFKVFDRFCILEHLSLMIFVAPHLGTIGKHLSGQLRISASWWWTLLLVLSVVQAWHGPMPMTDKKPSPFYHRITKEAGDFVLAELPLEREGCIVVGHAMYCQTIHHKRLVNGEASRMPADIFERLAKHRIIDLLEKYTDPNKYPVSPGELQACLEDARKIRLRYVVLHLAMMDSGGRKTLEDFLRDEARATLDYEEPGMRVYRLPE